MRLALGEVLLKQKLLLQSLHQQSSQTKFKEVEETSVSSIDTIRLHDTDHLPHLANYDDDNANEMITKIQELDVEEMRA